MKPRYQDISADDGGGNVNGKGDQFFLNLLKMRSMYMDVNGTDAKLILVYNHICIYFLLLKINTDIARVLDLLSIFEKTEYD